MLLDVAVYTPKEILFEGKARSVLLPGEEGVCEILPFHKRFITRLLSGMVFVDQQGFYIKRGIVKVSQNTVTIIMEEAKAE
jgi:F0F1-type ATP synthase epsilon subunit